MPKAMKPPELTPSPELAPSPFKELAGAGAGAGAGAAGRSGETGSGARLGISDAGWSTRDAAAVLDTETGALAEGKQW